MFDNVLAFFLTRLVAVLEVVNLYIVSTGLNRIALCKHLKRIR